MKLGILLLSLSFAAFAETAPVIPQKLLEHHLAMCPDFGSDYGKYFSREKFTLPKAEHSASIKTLYVLGCEMYAYNSREKAYIIDEQGVVTDVYVAEIDYQGTLTATSDLMGSGYDDATKTLGTFQLGRGIGDCGAASLYLYSPEDEKFILKEARIKNNCDGDAESEWPVVYPK